MERTQAEQLAGVIRDWGASDVPEGVAFADLGVEPLSGFHTFVDDRPIVGAFRVDDERAGAWHFFLIQWSRHRPGRYHLVVYQNVGEGPHIEAWRSDGRTLSWRYSPRKQDGRNDERKNRFIAAAGDTNVRFALPIRTADVPAFLNSLRNAVRLRLQADNLDQNMPEVRAPTPAAGADEPARTRLGELIEPTHANDVLVAFERSVQRAAIQGETTWATSVRPRAIRLNSGRIQAAVIESGALRVVVHESELPVDVVEQVRAFQDSSSTYALDADAMDLLLPADRVGALYPRVEDAHRALIEHAGQAKCPYRRSHSNSVLVLLERELGVSLPRPMVPETVRHETRYWKLAPGEGARLWSNWLEQGYISIGWSELGDLSGFDKESFDKRLREVRAEHPTWGKHGPRQAWLFHELRPGDRIVANKGLGRVLGIGTVTGDYYFVPGIPVEDHSHRMPVRWDDTTPRSVQYGGWRKTLVRLRRTTFEEIEQAEDVFEELPEWTTDFGELFDEVSDELFVSQEQISNLLLALQCKRFAILTGISGTGKTQIALKLARALSVSEEAVEVVAVRPDWTDNRGLLGFYNPLVEHYVGTLALSLMLRAHASYQRTLDTGVALEPHFLILDEMNLARVEQYFSDFLSAMESGEAISLHDQGTFVSSAGDGPDVPSSLGVPPNLLVIGTVNVDETTYMFSPKVLDRAFTIEFNQVALKQYGREELATDDGAGTDELVLAEFENLVLTGKRPGIDDWRGFLELENGQLADTIIAFNEQLEREGRHFGYRVANEIARFVELAGEQSERGHEDLWAALDLAVLQKVLAKLHGTQQELESILVALFKLSVSPTGTCPDVDPLLGWKAEAGRLVAQQAATTSTAVTMPRTGAKLYRMLHRLRRLGFTSFVE